TDAIWLEVEKIQRERVVAVQPQKSSRLSLSVKEPEIRSAVASCDNVNPLAIAIITGPPWCNESHADSTVTSKSKAESFIPITVVNDHADGLTPTLAFLRIRHRCADEDAFTTLFIFDDDSSCV